MPNLERLIAQNAFTSEEQKSIIGLIFVGNWITSRHQRFFKQYEITLQQFNILRILRGQYPNAANIGLLRERMLDRMSDVSRLVERLRIAELAERTPNENDRRSVDVKITKKGLSLLKDIDENMQEMYQLTSGLSDKEMKSLNELLDKLLINYL